MRQHATLWRWWKKVGYELGRPLKAAIEGSPAISNGFERSLCRNLRRVSPSALGKYVVGLFRVRSPASAREFGLRCLWNA